MPGTRGSASRALCALLVAALLLGLTGSRGDAKPLTPRRTFGALFVGSSLLMAKKALDYHRDADRVYEAYKVADNAAGAAILFERASDRDTKSQLSAGISLLLLVSGVRLLMFSGQDDNVPKLRRGIGLEMTREAKTGAVGVALRKAF